MRPTSRLTALALLALSNISAGAALAQDYPSKPIRIVTGGAGGGIDFATRLIAQGLTDSFGQQMIVDSRGGSGVIVAEIVAKAPPDGYTLLAFGPPFWIGALMQKTPYDPIRDFSPITLAVKSPNVLVVHPSLPVNSVRELIALAKARPGELNYSSGAAGASNHLAAELFKAMAGVDIVRIPYRGAGPALTALISGETQLMFPNAAAATPHLRSGRLKALAVTSGRPSMLAPNLPTVAASGLRGYESVLILGIFAPAGTPPVRIKRLNQEIARVVNRADVKERFLSSGMETVGSTPDELAAAMKSDMARLGKLIKDAGIRAE